MADDVIDRLKARLQASPDDPYLLLNLAAHLRRAGRIPESSELYLRCHQVYVEAGRQERADACLQQLLRFDPENLRARLLLTPTDETGPQ